MADIGGKFLSDSDVFQRFRLPCPYQFKKGVQFFVSRYIFQMFHVIRHLRNRPDKRPGKAFGKPHGHQKRTCSDQQDGRQNISINMKDASRLFRNANYTSISCFSCIKENTPFHRPGFAAAHTLAAFHGLNDFRPVPMIFHERIPCIAVVQYRAVRRNPGNSQLIFRLNKPAVFHLFRQMQVFNHSGSCRKIGKNLLPQQTVRYGGSKEHTQKNRHQNDEHKIQINFSCHFLLSSSAR